MQFKTLVICFSCIFSHLLGSLTSSKEIRICLSTASPLESLYLGQVLSSDNSFPSAYLAQLYSILAFDLTYNGVTRVLPQQNDREEELRKLNPLSNGSIWKNWGIGYAVKVDIKNKAIVVSCFSSQSATFKQFPNILLTGSLAKDRKILHRLSDAILKTFWGKEGVASTKILYSVKQKKGDRFVAEIWSCDWDGANPTQLTHEDNYCVSPVFVPQSARYANDRFMYVSYKHGQPKIFIASLSNGAGKRLVDLKGNQLLPAITSQRNKIAFICDVAGQADLFMQEFDPMRGEVAKPIQLFSCPRATQASPTFSPDGSKIAFVSDKDGSPRIYLISATYHEKRETPVLLTKKNIENSCPSWSPDGSKIAYSAKTKGVRQIWIYDFDRQEEWQLTDGSGNKENPSWALDSLHLVFNSTDGHISELYLVNLNQPDVVKISSGPGVKHYPVWGKN